MANHRGEYPDDWDEIAWRVKDRVGWRCDRCNHLDDKDTHHVLTVHHFDHDKSNCADWNTMPLCQRCHLSVQGRVDPRNPLLFDPSPWSLPYIAGFYEESKDAMPSPLYDLARWIVEYEKEFGSWPDWAPTESKHERPSDE